MTVRAKKVRDVESLITIVNEMIRTELAGMDDPEAAMDLLRIGGIARLEADLTDRYEREISIGEAADGSGLWLSLGSWRPTLLPYPFTLDDLYAELDAKYHRNEVSSEIDRLEEDIEKLEGFKVVVANWRDLLDGPEPERYIYLPRRTLNSLPRKGLDGNVSHSYVRYPAEGTHRKPAGGRISVATWLRRRIAPLYPGYVVHAVLPDGRRAPESMTLTQLRETWSKPPKAIREPLTRQADKLISNEDELLAAFRVADMAEFMRVYSVLLGNEAHLAERSGDDLLIEADSCLWMLKFPTSKRWELEALERFKWLIALERQATHLKWSIERCEGFRPSVSVNDYEVELPDEYGYSDPAPGELTLQQWKQQRIGDRFPDLSFYVRRPDGTTPRDSMTLRTLRKLWSGHVYWPAGA
jgi:hypothetical protein